MVIDLRTELKSMFSIMTHLFKCFSFKGGGGRAPMLVPGYVEKSYCRKNSTASRRDTNSDTF